MLTLVKSLRIISLYSYLQLSKLPLFSALTILQIHFYHILRIIGLIICIDLFVVFLMEGGECRYFFLNRYQIKKKIFYEVMRLDYFIISTYTLHRTFLNKWSKTTSSTYKLNRLNLITVCKLHYWYRDVFLRKIWFCCSDHSIASLMVKILTNLYLPII